MKVHLEGFSTGRNRAVDLGIVDEGEERTFIQSADERVRVIVGEAVVIFDEQRQYQEVPNGFFRRLVTGQETRKIATDWKSIGEETIRESGETQRIFSEGLSEFGILKVKALE